MRILEDLRRICFSFPKDMGSMANPKPRTAETRNRSKNLENQAKETKRNVNQNQESNIQETWKVQIHEH